MGTSGQEKKTEKSTEDLLFFPVPNLTKADIDKIGTVRVVVNEQEIALISYNKILYALQDKCPHNGGPLSQGDIEDLPGGGKCIRCPWHGWKFDLKTGKCVSPSHRGDKVANTFPIRIDCAGEKISLGFTEIAPEIFKRIPP